MDTACYDLRREAYEKMAREDGFTDFQIREIVTRGKMKRADRRAEYFPVYFVEPYKGNEIALGFDLASNHMHERKPVTDWTLR
jgi:CHASE1-domain containing sensor protein